jgi:hypothetical protein
MTSDLDQELRTAFSEASDFVQPPPGMADRVRSATQRRRRRLAAAVASATAAAVIVAGGGFLATHDWHRAGKHGLPATTVHGFTITFPDGDTAQQLATSGPYLYALIGPSDSEGVSLAAYDRGTGRLVHEVSVPGAGGSALAIGPGGLVWLSFAASTSAGPSGTWLLSPDLRFHSGAGGGAAYVLLPISRAAALIPDQNGLILVRLPLPGRPGRSTERLEPGTSLGQSLKTAPGVSAAVLDGRIVVQVTNGSGFDSHLVVAGHPHITFGGRAANQVGFTAQIGDSVWVATYAVHGQYATDFGKLLRLNSKLDPTTPTSVLDSPVLARTEQVWGDAGTVWAATLAPGHALVCFAASGRTGPIITLPVHAPVTALAAADGTVYVTTTPRDAASGTVTSYPVPAACR